MGSGKKEAARKVRQGKVGDGMANVKVKGENFYRSAKKVKVLNILKGGDPQRNAHGRITKSAVFQSREAGPARIEPNRKWFTNSRVISQDSLAQFRDAVAEQKSDPHTYILKTNKLPMSLINDPETKNGLKQHLAKQTIETASFSDTFGPKAQRKKPKIDIASFQDLQSDSEKKHASHLERLEELKLLSGAGIGAEAEREDGGDVWNTGTGAQLAKEAIFLKGQSKRIWNELYKVIDSSDVILHVLDARDPLGTRCRAIEKYLKEEAPHKHLVFILNKCDLVPTAVAAHWVRLLSKEFPTLAFHASITNSFGKGSLIALLRQFAILHSDRKQVSAGLIGYPNSGKSSIINTLRAKQVCTTAPVPGETKIWQYITLTKRIYLIDCPGVVPPNANDSAEDILLRGVVRVEAVENPAQYVEAALKRVQKKHLDRTYGLDPDSYTTSDEFLEVLARRRGKLHKANVPDFDGIAVTVLREFLRGKIPWYVPPPDWEQRDSAAPKITGREGRLGEMAGKRKREDEDKAEAALQAAKRIAREKDENEDDEDEDEDEFEGFEGTGVVLPGAIGDLRPFEENEDIEDENQDDEVEDNEGEDEDAEETVPTHAIMKTNTKPSTSKRDTRPPAKKRGKS
ncbi:nucleolar gtp-binding 2 protein [Venturia nashicola]|uniref:Nucleolar GTP-binding protein 2 n=1 Tax=Venturia nashicola TaxID=86259 RepID=A0A4Z1P4P3_9PEZI|nr:nucleolar gtp-binding 2 protein [Venturia nashicola]TLD35767.1 nucleolar gtp-binding 2 protein [Venturia nashicola]